MRRTVLTLIGTAAALAAAPAASQAASSYTFENGHLAISATGDDDISITCEMAGTELRVNGQVAGTSCNAVKSIDIKGGDGDTTINLSQIGATLFDEVALDRNFVIDSGAGSDQINGAALPERVVARGSGLQLVDTGPSAAKLRTIETDHNDTLNAVDIVELQGTDGPDYLEVAAYTQGAVYVYGNGGDDEFLGPLKEHVWQTELHGGSGNDTFNGGAAHEDFFGGDGNDTITAGPGDDEIDPGSGTDAVVGGDGTDQLVDSELGSQITLTPSSYLDDTSSASLTDVEEAGLFDPFPRISVSRIDASNWAGLLLVTARGGDDEVRGGVGRNELFGGEGHDRLIGGPQDDTLYGNGDNDYLEGGAGVDQLIGDSGADELRAIDGAADKLIHCGTEQDILRGDAADIAIASSCETATETVPAPPDQPKPDEPKPMDPPPPPPLDTVAPQLKLGKGTLSKKGIYSITVTCPAGEIACNGTATLTSSRKIGKRKVTFGKKAFNIAGGKSTTLKIKLSKKNLKLLRQRRRIAAVTSFDVRDAAGNRASASSRVSLGIRR